MSERLIKFQILLASRSARRRQILQEMGLPFTVISSSYREKSLKNKSPEELVITHARGKALFAGVAGFRKGNRIPVVLGADTIVVFKGRILGKPRSYAFAAETLAGMAGKRHEVLTGMVLYHPPTQTTREAITRSRVTFKRWGPDRIAKYVRAARVLDKAGGYAIQSRPTIVSSYSGSRSNIIGLPKEKLRPMLRRLLQELTA